MKILFARCNVNENVGMGHIIRTTEICKTLSKKFKIIFLLDKYNHKIETINNFQKIYLYKKNEKFSYKSETLKLRKILKKNKVDLFIIDDYRFDNRLEKIIKKKSKLVIIDDLANRKHFCDLLIDFGWYGINTYKRYKGLINKDCKLLLGPKYFPLKKYIKRNNQNNKKSKKITNILLYFGGGSFSYNINKVIEKIIRQSKKNFKDEVKINLVIGQFNHNFIIKKSIKNNVILCRSKKNINYLYSKSDFFFCLPNSSIYNLLFNEKTPQTFLIFNQKIQNQIKPYLSDLGINTYNSIKKITEKEIQIFLKKKLKHKEKLKKKIFIDDKGSERISEFINNELFSDKAYNNVDDKLIFQYLKFRNQKNNRLMSINTKKIKLIDHIYWWHNSFDIKKFYLVKKKIIFFFFYNKINNFHNIGFLSSMNVNLFDLVNAYDFLIKKLNKIQGYVNIKNKVFIFLNKEFNFKIIKKLKIKKNNFYLMKKN
jgi:spore coat polysaccharide biosynthesis predicted glycosyltransferase SpsG